jgi:hypothetical protein
MSPKPSYGLYDCTAQAWAPSGTKSKWKGVERQFEKVGDTFKCAVQVLYRRLIDYPPGEDERGEWLVYSDRGSPFMEEGYLIEVLSGPEKGIWLRVNDAYKPRGRFQQTNCMKWKGEIPSD